MYQVCGNYPAFASFLEEFESLKKFTDVAAQGDDFVIPVDEIELLKTARQMILHRKAVLHESLTLFPVGLFIQQSCNMAMESVCRDKGFDVLVKPDSHDIGPSKSGGACSEAAAHRSCGFESFQVRESQLDQVGGCENPGACHCPVASVYGEVPEGLSGG